MKFVQNHLPNHTTKPQIKKKGQDSNKLLGLELTWVVLIAVSSLLVICACIVGIAICICRRSTRNPPNHMNNTSIQCKLI
jgi:hypothetical protein